MFSAVATATAERPNGHGGKIGSNAASAAATANAASTASVQSAGGSRFVNLAAAAGAVDAQPVPQGQSQAGASLSPRTSKAGTKGTSGGVSRSGAVTTTATTPRTNASIALERKQTADDSSRPTKIAKKSSNSTSASSSSATATTAPAAAGAATAAAGSTSSTRKPKPNTKNPSYADPLGIYAPLIRLRRKRDAATVSYFSSSQNGGYPIVPLPPRTLGGLRDQIVRTKQCNCKRSHCLKLYCECFASGVHCSSALCNCTSCKNNGSTAENDRCRTSAIKATLERNPHAFRPRAATVSAAATAAAAAATASLAGAGGGAGSSPQMPSIPTAVNSKVGSSARQQQQQQQQQQVLQASELTARNAATVALPSASLSRRPASGEKHLLDHKLYQSRAAAAAAGGSGGSATSGAERYTPPSNVSKVGKKLNTVGKTNEESLKKTSAANNKQAKMHGGAAPPYTGNTPPASPHPANKTAVSAAHQNTPLSPDTIGTRKSTSAGRTQEEDSSSSAASATHPLSPQPNATSTNPSIPGTPALPETPQDANTTPTSNNVHPNNSNPNSNNSTQARGCNCRKSYCLKKYCECFQAGLYCQFPHCTCSNCHNVQGNVARERAFQRRRFMMFLPHNRVNHKGEGAGGEGSEVETMGEVSNGSNRVRVGAGAGAGAGTAAGSARAASAASGGTSVSSPSPFPPSYGGTRGGASSQDAGVTSPHPSMASARSPAGNTGNTLHSAPPSATHHENGAGASTAAAAAPSVLSPTPSVTGTMSAMHSATSSHANTSHPSGVIPPSIHVSAVPDGVEADVDAFLPPSCSAVPMILEGAAAPVLSFGTAGTVGMRAADVAVADHGGQIRGGQVAGGQQQGGSLALKKGTIHEPVNGTSVHPWQGMAHKESGTQADIACSPTLSSSVTDPPWSKGVMGRDGLTGLPKALSVELSRCIEEKSRKSELLDGDNSMDKEGSGGVVEDGKSVSDEAQRQNRRSASSGKRKSKRSGRKKDYAAKWARSAVDSTEQSIRAISSAMDRAKTEVEENQHRVIFRKSLDQDENDSSSSAVMQNQEEEDDSAIESNTQKLTASNTLLCKESIDEQATSAGGSNKDAKKDRSIQEKIAACAEDAVMYHLLAATIRSTAVQLSERRWQNDQQEATHTSQRPV